MIDPLPRSVSTDWTLARYQQVRHRLPRVEFTGTPRAADSLAPLIDLFDAFVFDSFGVLNVGDRAISGARARIDQLRACNKNILVLTNAATVPLADLQEKYAWLGFGFERHEIISSRQVMAEALNGFESNMIWGVAAPEEAALEELPCRSQHLTDLQTDYDKCDGFILLSSQNWCASKQHMLAAALTQLPRPLLVGNPDVVAPREGGLTLEPGAYAHAVLDSLSMTARFFGKPFGNAFAAVKEKLAPDIAPHRIAMVGDSLHTDILGAAAAGWQSILVTDHGLMKGLNITSAIKTTGIVPDFIIPSI